MKIAFIILAHKNPAQISRLLQRLSHPQIDCYIHLDAKSNIADYAAIQAMPQVFFTPLRANVRWAGFGTIQASLNGIAAVLEAKQQYAFMHLISAQDYPLKSAQEIYDFSMQHVGKELLDLLPAPALEAVMSKITQYHFENWDFKGKYFFTRLVNKIMPARKTPLGMKAYGGSMWWGLSEACGAYCLQFVKDHPVLRRFYTYTWGGDEFIFQTIIMQSTYRENVRNDYQRYIDWSEGKAHPKTFTDKDFSAIMQSGQLLARKFDMDATPALLDRIDAVVDEKKR